MGIGVDLSTWPVWVLVVLILVNLFKDQLGAFFSVAIREHFKDRAARQADIQEFQQNLEETLVNSQLQTQAAEQLRKSWREEQWVELIQRKDAWLQEVLEKQLDRLQASSDKQLETLIALQRNSMRTNDLLTVMSINLSKMAEGEKD